MPDSTRREEAKLPPRWVIRSFWSVHRGLFRATGGRLGLKPPRGDDYGLMRLTATGRRSGRPRSVMLGYFEDGPNLVTMAMNGWGDPEPAWWLNLRANPDARIELPGGQARQVRAHAATGDERARLWDRWRTIDKGLDAYAARRSRETAVVVFTLLTD
ncbi:nitroreductase/quinone reductase family protein [Asanoa siamensis]|uniref:Nitroreductase n=1 Tax=Asanoa siamensis TaxID=926357 RepID=A0ABQ4CJT0_9ACTN|nr:nitroreductase/quinone reductase family protein [Asanoa siamensis]GIF71551.1 nitroreductase [Asanoa siamensis]